MALTTPRDLPETSGIYMFSDADGRVLYVGKAKLLRNRLGFHAVRASAATTCARSTLCG